MTRVALLGATGSIGRQALEVVDADPTLEICALAAGRADAELAALARARGVELIALADEQAAARAGERFSGRVLGGPNGVARLAVESGADVALNAVVGAAGLDATLAALEHGIDVALANKESIVAAGPLVLAAAARSGARVIPVDSEHAALHQLLAHEQPDAVLALVLTASGGPFRGRSRAELEDVTVEQALRHPTWSMGAKITVDSATLANKGLELIEAHHLFGVPYERVEVVVHPQSLVHALVRLHDGSLLAHAGLPDMRVPIAYALCHPRRRPTAVGQLDLASGLTLEFEAPDVEAFRCLALARAAGESGGTHPCVFNAANEEAVAAFLAGGCAFTEIDELVARALDEVPRAPLEQRAQLREVDRAARGVVRAALAGQAVG
jgi:1-deoxy-D-xylulose-5-phosphate reductoisomerase